MTPCHLVRSNTSLENWTKVEDRSGFIYYISKNDTRQWDHPNFYSVQLRLVGSNIIHDPAYKIANKLKCLQHILNMVHIPLPLIDGVFTRHRLGNTEATLTLESSELEAVLDDIFFAAHKQNLVQKRDTEVEEAFPMPELVLNLLYDMFDKEREGKLQVISAKVVLSLLSSASVSEIHRYLYALVTDHNDCVTRRRLHSLLVHLATVADYLDDSKTFSHELISAAVESCFSNSPGMLGIDEHSFMKWLQEKPPILAWLRAFNNMKIADNVIHNVRCSTCKCSPIRGLRFKCAKCICYTQCTPCYFAGKVSQSHKMTHPVYECCLPETYSVMQSIRKRIHSILKCSRKKPLNQRKLQINSHLSGSELTNVTPAPSNASLVNSPDEQLANVIRQLEEQNRQLHQLLSVLWSGALNEDMWKYLDQHRTKVATQISKLKKLRHHLENDGSPIRPARALVGSTPMVLGTNGRLRYNAMEMFSPIAFVEEENDEEQDDETVVGETQNQMDTVVGAVSVPYNFTVPSYSLADLSTWIGGRPVTPTDSSMSSVSRAKEIHGDLDAVLEKLQEILANNFMLDDAASSDNGQLQSAVTEMEDMLTSLIDGVEKSRIKRSGSIVVQSFTNNSLV